MSNKRVSKLADVKGSRAVDAFAALLDPVFEIAADPAAVRFFVGGEPMGRLERVRKLTQIIRRHKNAFIEIEAIKRGVSKDQCCAELSMDDVFTAGTELMNDPLFLSFFVLARRDESLTTDAPGSTEAKNG